MVVEVAVGLLVIIVPSRRRDIAVNVVQSQVARRLNGTRGRHLGVVVVLRLHHRVWYFPALLLAHPRRVD